MQYLSVTFNITFLEIRDICAESHLLSCPCYLECPLPGMHHAVNEGSLLSQGF